MHAGAYLRSGTADRCATRVLLRIVGSVVLGVGKVLGKILLYLYLCLCLCLEWARLLL